MGSPIGGVIRSQDYPAGEQRFSAEEAKALIDELLSLDNPYHCPHGRPTMIVLSKQEMERKFKRIV